MLCSYAFLYVANNLTDEVVEYVDNRQDIIYYLSTIIRLYNDLGTSTAELERGDAPSSILCYMREKNVSEEIARRHIRGLITQMWRKLNGQCMNQSPSVQKLVKICINIARQACCTYQYGDGFGVQDRQTRNRIRSLLIEPLNLSFPNVISKV